jgi:ribosomal protein S18 acetylase RimI-like enzyme
VIGIDEITIRKYQPRDFERLYEIDHLAFSEEIAYSHLELQYYLRSRRCRTLVAEKEGETVGFVIACSEPKRLGHIITIDVTPSAQRRGVGSKLLGEIENWLWEQGAEVIYLETPVDDAGAKDFYDRHGYFVFDRIEEYYSDSLDAFVMMKTARPASSAKKT